MISFKVSRVFFLTLCFGCLFGASTLANAQDSTQPQRNVAQRDDDVNLETQLYLIVATNRDIDESRTPPALEPVLKRLHESLTFKHYSLAAVFLNRVKNGGRLDVSWVGGASMVNPSSSIGNPSFNQFAAVVRLVPDAAGNEIVRMNDFRFGARVPIVTTPFPTNASTAATTLPVVNYEPVGLHTDLSLREGTPVIAGTLNVGPSGDALVVAIAARRTN